MIVRSVDSSFKDTEDGFKIDTMDQLIEIEIVEAQRLQFAFDHYGAANQYRYISKKYRILLDKKPDVSARVDLGQAENWCLEHKFELALPILLNLLDKSDTLVLVPSIGKCYYWLGRCFDSTERFAEAGSAYSRSFELMLGEPDLSELLLLPKVAFFAGMIFERQGDISSALSWYRKSMNVQQRAGSVDLDLVRVRLRIAVCNRLLFEKDEVGTYELASKSELLLNGQSSELMKTNEVWHSKCLHK